MTGPQWSAPYPADQPEVDPGPPERVGEQMNPGRPAAQLVPEVLPGAQPEVAALRVGEADGLLSAPELPAHKRAIPSLGI
jgi:hypothetical protein